MREDGCTADAADIPIRSDALPGESAMQKKNALGIAFQSKVEVKTEPSVI